MLTGPSMFLIPMGLLKVGKPVIGKTMNVPMKEIKALGNININSIEEYKAVGERYEFLRTQKIDLEEVKDYLR